jgi:3-phenylpropionate/cinnamic acid dioxygenase small subunit
MVQDGHAEALIAEIADESRRLRPLAESLPALEQTRADLERRIARIEGSVSWRLTTPLRASRALMVGRRMLAVRVGRRLRAYLER